MTWCWAAEGQWTLWRAWWNKKRFLAHFDKICCCSLNLLIVELHFQFLKSHPGSHTRTSWSQWPRATSGRRGPPMMSRIMLQLSLLIRPYFLHVLKRSWKQLLVDTRSSPSFVCLRPLSTRAFWAFGLWYNLFTVVDCMYLFGVSCLNNSLFIQEWISETVYLGFRVSWQWTHCIV